MDSKQDQEQLWMVAKDRNELYGEMGIGKFINYYFIRPRYILQTYDSLLMFIYFFL